MMESDKLQEVASVRFLRMLGWMCTPPDTRPDPEAKALAVAQQIQTSISALYGMLGPEALWSLKIVGPDDRASPEGKGVVAEIVLVTDGGDRKAFTCKAPSIPEAVSGILCALQDGTARPADAVMH